MSTLAHKQAALAYQQTVQLAQRQQVINAVDLFRIPHMTGDVFLRIIRNGVLQRTKERGVYFSLIKDPRR